MSLLKLLPTAFSVLILAGCAHGNIKSVASYHAPRPPKVKQPLFDPYASYGSAPAVWRPSLATRSGTIVKPTDPVDQGDRPNYEASKWGINQETAKAGTF